MRHALLLLPLLTACAAPEGTPGSDRRGLPGLFGPSEPAEPAAPEPLPPAVQAALPPGTPPSIVIQDAAGCYLYSVERTDPPSGYPLRDDAGQPICEGDVAVAEAGPTDFGTLPAEPVADAFDDADPFDAGGDADLSDDADAGDIDISPVLDAPFPSTPGSITPPAPIAPLNPT